MSARNGGWSTPDAEGTRPIWSTINGNGNFCIISESGMISGASGHATGRPVPATAFDAIDDPIENGHVRCTAEMFDEVETHPSDATPIERIKIFIGEAIVYNGDATIAFGVGCNAIQHGGIVGSRWQLSLARLQSPAGHRDGRATRPASLSARPWAYSAGWARTETAPRARTRGNERHRLREEA